MNHPRYGICIVLVYVDDILVVADYVDWIRSAKSAIGAEFNMTDFGEASFVLGMDLTRCWASGTIRLSQEQYTLDLLEKYGMQDCSPAKTPMGSINGSGLGESEGWLSSCITARVTAAAASCAMVRICATRRDICAAEAAC
eukprot:jgi/Tetstr1/439032/TSEL_027524.t1